MLKERIDQDLKKALLGGDKVLVTTLRGLKSVILYAEVAKGVRDTACRTTRLFRSLLKSQKNARKVPTSTAKR